jgi:polysaccharide export outer membrane protein
VLSAIQAVEGTLESADLSASVLVRADGKRIPLNLTRMLKGGAPEHNLTLLPGDTLHIPNNDANKVLVFGEVIKPQTITIESGKRQSMATALAQVGGWNPVSASMTHFYVLRNLPPEKTTPDADPQPVVGVYRLDASSADAWLLADQFTLRPRDVVYATTRGITEWNRFISQVIPTPFTYFFGGYTTYSDVGVQRP